VNLPVGSECFIPSMNTVILLVAFHTVDLSKGHENIAVLESNTRGIHPIRSPKPPNLVLSSTSVTRKKVVLLVLVEVCEFVKFAFYHGKITANLRFRAL